LILAGAAVVAAGSVVAARAAAATNRPLPIAQLADRGTYYEWWYGYLSAHINGTWWVYSPVDGWTETSWPFADTKVPQPDLPPQEIFTPEPARSSLPVM